MAKAQEHGSVKRFGSRYGRTTRAKAGKIEAEQRKKHKCPYCLATRVKRVAAGIWNCSKCGAKFTGKAYTISRIAKVKDEINDIKEAAEEIEEEPGEEEKTEEKEPKKEVKE